MHDDSSGAYESAVRLDRASGMVPDSRLFPRLKIVSDGGSAVGTLPTRWLFGAMISLQSSVTRRCITLSASAQVCGEHTPQVRHRRDGARNRAVQVVEAESQGGEARGEHGHLAEHVELS